jgi:hypothetical protein
MATIIQRAGYLKLLMVVRYCRTLFGEGGMIGFVGGSGADQINWVNEFQGWKGTPLRSDRRTLPPSALGETSQSPTPSPSLLCTTAHPTSPAFNTSLRTRRLVCLPLFQPNPTPPTQPPYSRPTLRVSCVTSIHARLPFLCFSCLGSASSFTLSSSPS